MEAQTATKKEGGMRLGPYLLMEANCFRAREDQGETAAMFGQSGKPTEHLPAIGRIEPDAALPRLRHAIVELGVVPDSHIPWPDDGSGRVEIKRPKYPKDFRGCKPFVIIGRIDIEILHPRSPRAADNQRL